MSPDAPPRPLAGSADAARLARIEMIATDVDGTLTTEGSVSAEVVAMLPRLRAAGVEVLPVSGRSAGEVLGLVRYLPGLDRGIAENGQVLVAPERKVERLRGDGSRADLEAAGRAIAAKLGTHLELAPDSFCRVGDVAYERAGRSDAEVLPIRDAAHARGLHCVWSSVHVHLSHEAPDKGRALLDQLERWGRPASSVATIGDAPNDVGLFDRGRFGLTVGTADVLEALEVLEALPEFVTHAREGAAFLELATAILDARAR